jgi:hypothetical protein
MDEDEWILFGGGWFWVVVVVVVGQQKIMDLFVCLL